MGKQPTDVLLIVLARRHLRFGWWSLLAYLSMGIVLEVFHGFKVGWYLDVSNETRRLMWTLAHAHGTLLALVHLAFFATLRAMESAEGRPLRWASGGLVASSVLLPGGFFLGGLIIHQGDPGLGILLVPVGAMTLLAAVWWIARGAAQFPQSSDRSPRAPQSEKRQAKAK